MNVFFTKYEPAYIWSRRVPPTSHFLTSSSTMTCSTAPRLARTAALRRRPAQPLAQCRKLTISAAPIPTSPPPVRIVSRASLARHAPSHPFLVKKPPPPPKIKDSSDVPWPLPMRIAGYTAMVLSIPYCGAHIISASPAVREWLEGDRPDLEDDCKTGKQLVSLVRQYWGESEGLPYADRLAMEEKEHEGKDQQQQPGSGDQPAIVDWAVLEADVPHDARVQQGKIEEMKHQPVSVRATLVPPGSTGLEYENGFDGTSSWSGKVEGTVPANRTDLVTALGAAGWEGAKQDVTQAQRQGTSTTSSAGLAAVDFDDDTASANATSSSSSTSSTSDDGFKTDDEMDAFESAGYQIASDEDEITHLKRLTTTWSAWHHESSWADNSQSSTSSPSTSSSARRSAPSGADALQIATLEHQIAQLQTDLKDPMCTRSFDDMERELKEARTELWRVKGGLGGKIRSALRL